MKKVNSMDALRFFRICSFSGSMLVIFLALALMGGNAFAIDVDMGGRPLRLMGYINQGVQYGIAGDHYDTKEGFQAAITQILLEGSYWASDSTKIFVSGMLDMDLAYPVLDDNNKWKDRQFDKSDDEKFILDDPETLLKEAHVTYSIGNSVFRVGKQIVAWGETDAERVMDQINPVDNRRGMTDVEFESTIVPIWLAKAEIFPAMNQEWLEDFGLELVFNPNAQFVEDKGFSTGNDVHGIWAADVPVAGMPARIGSLNQRLEEPDSWDGDYMEYGGRVKVMINGSFMTLNYFNGRANSPVTRATGNVSMESASDGWLILHPEMEGYYPRFQYVGATFSRDLSSLYINALGGVTPVIRFEGLYGIDNTYVTSGNPGADGKEQYVKYDQARYAIGLDWKIYIRALNPKAGFSISGQFIHKHVFDYPDQFALSDPEDSYMTTLNLSTNYMSGHLQPGVFWIRTFHDGQQGDIIIPSIMYEQDNHWNYKLQGFFAQNDLNAAFEHKDHISFTVGYRF